MLIQLNKIYLDKNNRVIFPYTKKIDITNNYNLVCYNTIYPIGDKRNYNIMKLIYLDPQGVCHYNNDESIIKELTPFNNLYRENKHFITQIKALLKDKNFKIYYYNAIIFPRSMLDANTKFKETNR